MPKRRVAAVSALLLFLLLAAPSTANACSCMPTTVEQQIQNVDAIFTGRVVSIRDDVQLPDTGHFVTLEVTDPYKGGLTGQVVVKTGFNSADCGIPFREGTEWLVYAFKGDQDMLSASSCTLTKEVSDAHSDLLKLKSVLGNPTSSTPASDSPSVSAPISSAQTSSSSSLYLLGGSLVLLAALVVFVRRSWRR